MCMTFSKFSVGDASKFTLALVEHFYDTLDVAVLVGLEAEPARVALLAILNEWCSQCN